MSVTLTNLQTDVRSWLATSSTRLPDSDLTSIINMAIRDICISHDLRFNEKSLSVTLSAGVGAYALPTTGATVFGRPRLAYLINPDNTDAIIILNQMDYGEFRDKWGIAATQDQGTPQDFTIWGEGASALIVGATPDRSMTLWLDYYQYPAELSAGGDSNNITNFMRDVVLFRACALASQFMLEESDRYAYFQGEYERLVAKYTHESGRARYGARGAPAMVEPH